MFFRASSQYRSYERGKTCALTWSSQWSVSECIPSRRMCTEPNRQRLRRARRLRAGESKNNDLGSRCASIRNPPIS